MLENRQISQNSDITYGKKSAIEQVFNYALNNDENFFADANVIIATWNSQGRITRINPFGQKVFGYSEEEIINKRWELLLVNKDDRFKIVNDFIQISKGLRITNHDIEFISKQNKKIDIMWNHSLMNYSNNQSEVLSIGIDITNRKLLEEKLSRIAYYDDLTGLQNRSFFVKEVKQLIEVKSQFTLVHINIDNFSQINDTLNYASGDHFLQYVASMLSEFIKAPDKVARLSGDEFAILFYDMIDKDVIENRLKSLDEYIGPSWEVNHNEFFISASKGIAMFPKDGADSNAIFRNANIAMNKAKKQGKGRAVFYMEQILKENNENIKLSNQLQYAIKNNELVLYYQPQYELTSGKISGFEALVRWNHPQKGLIPPMKFIPMAEETGQIYELERWIIETALKRKLIFEKEGKKDLYISINLSSKSLSSELNFTELEHIFSNYDIDYSHIVIEITETAIISDMGFAVERLKRLRRLGMKIALDDFGTGYSSLIHLKDLPIDIVKLDRNFVSSIEERGKASVIIKALLYLALDLDYEVVAEGIETKEQLEYLKKYKCETGQGYLMSKPITIEEVQQLLLLDKDNM
ncbi:sensor domain-containing protein [[Clostridium] fimetarium]|uniref:PAS domain S-box-containing protein/diguanylate cyclase (GGDEF) domain-containing protein n=1 Tax=[Clostridium] fimetarium TaxID=99656 RepID=A0A1I0MC24_9FIRM|nr:EAL domain-containing protein [[Clostridium] fimetarium]SEV85997.1 PAS domain S-box-containing protein/diguanylate cyclase (GGDEF) domain-containing protein [[Clostridium] fimetarium]